MTETEFRLRVNGAERSVAREPDTPSLDVLRHELGLAGPKFGCGMGLCGACFVLIEGRARASCDLAVSAVGGPVTTVEGLLDGGRLHPVQQAFIDEQAAQYTSPPCGARSTRSARTASCSEPTSPTKTGTSSSVPSITSATPRSTPPPHAPSSTRTPAPCSASTADHRADGWRG
ncbi:MAG: 2Fe-2S iron-sulfur cluster-binding protein [Streptosporangiaceae bacterium]